MSWNRLQYETTSDASILHFSGTARAACIVIRECLEDMTDRDVEEKDTTTWIVKPPLNIDSLALIDRACRDNETPLTIQPAMQLLEAA